MPEPLKLPASTLLETRRALDYFNGFHDGFMKRIEITSHDEMDEDRGQSCSGRFDVTIDFAHYNFADGDEPFHPYNQVVRGHFCEVQDLFCDFHSGYLGNSISNLTVCSMMRRKPFDSEAEECFGLQLARNFYLEEHRRYETRQSELFTFGEASFEVLACE